MTETAPICVFTYNRLEHTRRTIEALQRNELAQQSPLFIFSDGPRTESEAGRVAEVRSYLQTVTGFLTVELIERETNFGLARSITTGVTEVVSRFGQVIVLEDDMVTSSFFLRYMNDALALYRDEEQVISVHGYLYPVKKSLPETFLLRGADCWGWGTWKRAWDLFESDGQRLLQELRDRNLCALFDFNSSYPYVQMLEDQVAGRNDSWAIRWYASAFLKNRLTLYPGRSLVRNIGTDDSGAHCVHTSRFDTETATVPVQVGGIALREDAAARGAFERYFRSLRPGRLAKLRSALAGFLGRG